MSGPKAEAGLQAQVADYLRWQYPHVLFHSDFGSGAYLGKSQALWQYRQQGGHRGWPDLQVVCQRAKPVSWAVSHHVSGVLLTDSMSQRLVLSGLFLELKAEGHSPYRQDGRLRADPHLQEQAKTLEQLRWQGWVAEFATGFQQAKDLIDDYLKEEK